MSFPEVKAEDLALALNSVESLLSSQSSSSPALNLIIYIPPVHRNPANIYLYYFLCNKSYLHTSCS